MGDNSAIEGFGVVQVGEITSYGQWKKQADGHLEISFDSQSLSLDKQRDLENYQQSTTPIQVQIPGDREPARGVVIGFQRDQQTAKFYVSRPLPAAAQEKKAPLELRSRRRPSPPASSAPPSSRPKS
jgi:hypothetical protein